ncbi:hypothetical protein FVEN_g4877 [Fusarium venenatum]|uniref:Uncharacterized protein n=1 Tax=Fusarium venenatum TaxID=56646 RepID=A0A2L2T0K4_9HYPO|nr:uncharacterized protein FVRRES_11250 [Fusarium venenatum]KAG8357316.1 hypothetical protein FVEN_g4877 [Fusarium venenatum]CEI38559.1 unnamed protein product [Fusarium venenatum]
MCTTNIYTYVHPDGRREQYSQPTLCSNSRHGQVCSANFLFEHPHQYVSAYDASASYPYASQLPPTPQPSTPSGSYRSGDESDRSYSSSNSKKDRSSGVYINGQKVLDLNHKHRGSRHRQERIVLVDSPRTPPQQWSAPHTAPTSPNANTYMVDSSRDPYNRKPVIVDERTLQPERRFQIEVVDNHHRSKHHRHNSKESRHSNEDDERRRRREDKRQQEKEKLLQKRIAEANKAINERPVALAPSAPRRSSTYKRPSVEIPVDQLRRLSFEEERRDDKARRIARREEKKEEEAQRERLRERMQPKRRLTIGSGSRRPTEIYEPVYRYE